MQELINSLQVDQLNHNLKFLKLHIERIIEIDKEHLDLIIQNLRSFLNDQIDVLNSDILYLWIRTHQRH